MEIATKIAPLGLALIMLGIGMSLTIKDFTRSDFQKHITEAFRFLQNLVLLHQNVKKIRILWKSILKKENPKCLKWRLSIVLCNYSFTRETLHKGHLQK